MIAQQQEQVVQGPIDHPQYGVTLYLRPGLETQRTNRLISQAMIVTTAAQRLIATNREGTKLKALIVTMSDVDPTLHPEFHEISELLRTLLNKHFPRAKLILDSQDPHLDKPQVRHALTFYDLPMIRLEAGFQKTFAAQTGAAAGRFKELVENLKRVETEKLILRARFLRAPIDNSKDNEVKAWLRHIHDIKPSAVHVSTPTKGKEKGITKTRMGQILEQVAEKTGVPVEQVEEA